MKILFTFLACSIYCLAYGQNLVPNGDFEIYDPCPITQGHIEYAQPWSNPATATPDYFNTCAIGTNGGVPMNNRGFQIPLSGEGYAGILVSSIQSAPDVREYIQVQLPEPLVNGLSYELQFNVNLANSSNQAISTIGAHFSASDSLPLNSQLLDVTPQVVNSTGILLDTLNWMPIMGTYTAVGGETFITIGNFANDNDSAMEEVNGSNDWSFYYIDDVSLSSNITNTQDYYLSLKKIYPNPFYNNLNITSFDNQQYQFRLFDITGLQILDLYFVNSLTLNTMGISKGVYFYELNNSKEYIKRGKLIKQ